jgi:hypothetical protein
MNREIKSVINGLISSIIYSEINGLINPKNRRTIAFLLDFIPDGGNATPVGQVLGISG